MSHIIATTTVGGVGVSTDPGSELAIPKPGSSDSNRYPEAGVLSQLTSIELCSLERVRISYSNCH